jgi:hypothetical protein
MHSTFLLVKKLQAVKIGGEFAQREREKNKGKQQQANSIGFHPIMMS